MAKVRNLEIFTKLEHLFIKFVNLCYAKNEYHLLFLLSIRFLELYMP